MAIVNNIPFNVLSSYVYIGKNQGLVELLAEESRKGNVDVMIDSGAFTKHDALMKGSHKFDWLTIDSYCDWLHRYGGNFHKYVMLDKIQDDVQSRKNYEEMLKRGLNPMYVWTQFDTDTDYLKHASENNKEICVAGGSKDSDYIKQRYHKAYRICGSDVNIHALAYCKFPSIYQLPILSTDAASWINASGRYGIIQAYVGNGCLKQYPGFNKLYKAIKNHDVKLLKAIKESGLTVKDFQNTENFAGNFIPRYLSSIAFLKVQRYAWRLKKLRIYLSGIESESIYRQLKYVNDRMDIGGLDFNEWKSLNVNIKRK